MDPDVQDGLPDNGSTSMSADSPSLQHDDSAYQTPADTTNQGGSSGDLSAEKTDASSSSPLTKLDFKDEDVVGSAGQTICNMLSDLMGVLEGRVGAKVQLEGKLMLRIRGRAGWTVELKQEADGEETGLRCEVVRVTETAGLTNGRSQTEAAGRKRPLEHSADVQPSADTRVTDADTKDSQRKRPRLDGDATDGAAEPPRSTEAAAGAPPPGSVGGNSRPTVPLAHEERETATPIPSDPEMASVLSKLKNISHQIKWVEDCRRIADNHHDTREEHWRTTSATFHDEVRRVREKHENWMVREMTWQRDVLRQLLGELKGLGAAVHSVKWELPPGLPPAAHPPLQGPAQPKQPIPRGPGRPPGSLNKKR